MEALVGCFMLAACLHDGVSMNYVALNPKEKRKLTPLLSLLMYDETLRSMIFSPKSTTKPHREQRGSPKQAY